MFNNKNCTKMKEFSKKIDGNFYQVVIEAVDEEKQIRFEYYDSKIYQTEKEASEKGVDLIMKMTKDGRKVTNYKIKFLWL